MRRFGTQRPVHPAQNYVVARTEKILAVRFANAKTANRRTDNA